MDLEWDSRKAKLNEEKHGVSFIEASEVFSDRLSLSVADPDHSMTEDRFLIFGHSHTDKYLVVSYTERGNRIRIISARQMTAKERKAYEKDTLREEYPEDLITSGTRGKYAKQYQEGTNIVILDPDLHKLFPNSESVNRALREFISSKKSFKS